MRLKTKKAAKSKWTKCEPRSTSSNGIPRTGLMCHSRKSSMAPFPRGLWLEKANVHNSSGHEKLREPEMRCTRQSYTFEPSLVILNEMSTLTTTSRRMVCLCLAIASIGRAMQTQSEFRQHLERTEEKAIGEPNRLGKHAIATLFARCKASC